MGPVRAARADEPGRDAALGSQVAHQTILDFVHAGALRAMVQLLIISLHYMNTHTRDIMFLNYELKIKKLEIFFKLLFKKN